MPKFYYLMLKDGRLMGRNFYAADEQTHILPFTSPKLFEKFLQDHTMLIDKGIARPICIDYANPPLCEIEEKRGEPPRYYGLKA